MTVAVIVLAVALIAAGIAGRRAVRKLRARLDALETDANAAQRWRDAVRKAIGA